MRTHKPLNFLNHFVFVPWLTFWSQGGSHLVDGSHIHVVFGHAQKNNICAKSPQAAVFNAVIARSPESRSKGLGGRFTPLKKNEGMLFVFDPPQAVSFWMKDTHIPLDIAFFDKHGRFTHLKKMPVEKDPDAPLAQYPSRGPVSSALEIKPGAAGTIAEDSTLCICTLDRCN